jgi:cytoskeletal protein RodZ
MANFYQIFCLSISLYYIVTGISLFLFWFQYYFIIQISEASEEGSLDRNPELMESDEEYQQKNNSNQSPDKKVNTSEQDKDNDGNDSVEAKKDTTNETPKETVFTVKDEIKEVNNDRTKDEKEAPTTTSKDISIQTDPNALSPNKYR